MFDYKKNNFKTVKYNNKILFYIKINNHYIEVNKIVYKTLKNYYEYTKYQRKKEVKYGVFNVDDIDNFASFYFEKKSMNNTRNILINDILKIILNEINKMDLRDKKITYLYFLKDYPVCQISRILNIPQTTISYRKQKIQKILKKSILEKYSYEDIFNNN